MKVRELIQQLETIENKDIKILTNNCEPCTTKLISFQNAKTREIEGYALRQIVSEDWLRLDDTSDLQNEY